MRQRGVAAAGTGAILRGGGGGAEGPRVSDRFQTEALGPQHPPAGGTAGGGYGIDRQDLEAIGPGTAAQCDGAGFDGCGGDV